MKLLVDMNFVMFRSMHTSTSMTMDVSWAPRPVSTGSAKLAFSTILRVFNRLKKANPTMKMSDIVVCDDWGRSFRKDLFPGYKKKRSEKKRTPEEENAFTDMFVMKNLVLYVLDCLDCHTYAKKRYEADDTIGFLTRIFSRGKVNSCILSSDSDLSQLINPYTSMIRPEGKDLMHYTLSNMAYMVRFNNKNKDYWGCETPYDILLFKALVGDSTDEYPGVPGFGEAKWLKIKEHMKMNDITSANVLADPDTFFSEYGWTGKAAKKVDEIFIKHKESYLLCKKLAKIQRNGKPVRKKVFYRPSQSEGSMDPINAVYSPGKFDFESAMKALSSYEMRETIETLRDMRVMGIL